MIQRIATLVLPLTLLAATAASTPALAQDANPKAKPWILKMKEKWPDQHAGWEKTFDGVAAARAAYKAFAEGEWKAAGKGAWGNVELRQKRHDLFVALRNAEIAHTEWNLGWKKHEIKVETDSFEAFKAKAAAKAAKAAAKVAQPK